jgi:hypothetical protein
MTARTKTEDSTQTDSPDGVPLGFGGVEADVGDHIAHFFRGDAQRFAVLGPYIKAGLRRDERCVFIARPAVGEQLCEWLGDRGVDADAARSRDQLILHPGEATEEDMKRLAARVDTTAREEDEALIRWAGDGEWALEQEISVCEMLRWEALYDKHATDWALLALCQFNLAAFESDVIMDALRTHPYCVMGEVVVPNPFHESPEVVRKELEECG